MSYIIKITSDECPPRYFQRFNGFVPPSLTPASNLAKKMSLSEAETALEKIKGFISKEKGGETVTAELMEIAEPKASENSLIEDVPSALNWKEQGSLYGVSFHVARSGNSSYYRCVVNGKTRAQKRDGRVVAAEFSRALLKIMEERIDAHEERIANL